MSLWLALFSYINLTIHCIAASLRSSHARKTIKAVLWTPVSNIYCSPDTKKTPECLLCLEKQRKGFFFFFGSEVWKNIATDVQTDIQEAKSQQLFYSSSAVWLGTQQSCDTFLGGLWGARYTPHATQAHPLIWNIFSEYCFLSVMFNCSSADSFSHSCSHH